MGRTRIKNAQVARALRDRIVSGQWPPGTQLPSRQRLEQQYGISRNTLQRVMDQLHADGFICSNGRAGTFVADAPPHHTRYALLIPAEHDPEHHRFWHALAEQARAINRQYSPYDLSVYYGVESGQRDASYERLVEEIRTHRLAGLIFASSVQYLHGTPLLDEPGIPRVVIASSAPRPDLPTVEPNFRQWLERALRFVLERGRQRMAIMAHRPSQVEGLLGELTTQFGVHLPPKWRLYPSPHEPLGARHLTQLLVDAPADQRPDALLVMDDHLVEPVALGLADANVHVPEHLLVVAHANYPYPPPSAMPVERLGFDSREVLSHCLDAIDRQRRGQTPEPHTLIPARFENERLDQEQLAWNGGDAQPMHELVEATR